MKINFQTSGGFAHLPALSKPSTIDTSEIDSNIASQLESLVRESRFFELPTRVSTVAKGAADHRTYTITIEDSNHTHTIQLTDPITDSSLQQLVNQLRMISRHRPEDK